MLMRHYQTGTDAVQYRYKFFKNEQSIRMLTLHQGFHCDPIEGTLEDFDIVTAPSKQYEALSYVWGDADRLRSIKCHHQDLPITASLHDALRRLRWRDRPRILWVDQVCINQDDLAERSQQVQFMNKIYANAHHVLVWLGADEHAWAGPAFQRIRDLHNMIEEGQLKRERLESLPEDTWVHLRHMTKLPWFRRAWIVQEIGTPAEATLLWGTEQIDWKIAHRVCETLTDSHHLRKKLNIKTNVIKYVFQRFVAPERTSRHANRFSLMYELHRARHLEVSDQRDRVFAMLGHYSVKEPNAHLASLQAQYNKTTEEVYRDVAVRALKGDDSLITLAAVQHLQFHAADNEHKEKSSKARRVTEHTLPSWAPDWNSAFDPSNKYHTHMLSEPISPHRAHGATVPSLEVDSTNLILHIHGVRLDTIAACSEPLADRDFHLSEGPCHQAVQYLWHDVCGLMAFDLDHKYINEESAVFAFLQSLSNGGASTASRDHRPYEDIPNAEWLAHGASYLIQAVSALHSLSPEHLPLNLQSASQDGGHHIWTRAANGASKNRKFARTEKGFYVLGPRVMEVGDVVCVLLGGKIPFCLRPYGERYLLVGECYVHGMMSGEAIDLMESGDMQEEVFDVI